MVSMKKHEHLFGKDFFGPIAHRGLHDSVLTENGMKAFEKAVSNNLPFEFDIHLTKDGELVVCHDDDLIRTTGKAGIIEELTLKEIKENYRLLDGGEIPTLKEVMDMNQERSLMVIELKVHEGKNYKELGKAAVKALKNVKDKKKYTIISFDPRALAQFLFKGFALQLLVCKKYENAWKFKWLFGSVDVESCMLKEPKVIKYRKKHIVNVWTIESEQEMIDYKEYADAQTFQFIPADRVKEILL